jgi:hypothetical protein
MTDIDCESVRIAAMAIADDEESSLRPGEIEVHLLNCEACREEIEQLRATNQLFGSQQRLRPEANLWPAISERLQATADTAQTFRWRVLLLFGLPLFGYKFFMLLLQVTPSLWSKLVPVILMIAIFAYLKTNPFKINCELTLEGETTV